MKRPGILAALLCVAVPTVLGTLWLRGRDAGTPVGAASEPREVSGSAGGPSAAGEQGAFRAVPGASEFPGVRLSWMPGARQTYRVVVDAAIDMALAGEGEWARLTQRLEGVLHMRVFESGLDRALVGFQFLPVALDLSGQSNPDVDALLSLPFLTAFDANGRPESFRFPAGMPTLARGILEEAVRTFQVVVSEDAAGSWTTSEDHATGRYLAHYSLGRDGVLWKKKTDYVSVRSEAMAASPGSASARLHSSSIAIRISPSASWLGSVQIREELSLLAETRAFARSSTQATLERVPLAEPAGLALHAASAPQDLLKRHATAPSPAGQGIQRMDDATVRRELDGTVGRFGKDGKWDVTLIDRLVDLLRGHPQGIGHLLEILADPGTSDLQATALLHVLELVGTPEAQEALVGVVEDPSHRGPNRTRAIINLGAVAEPTGETIRALWDVADDRGGEDAMERADTAVLALGRIGNTVRTGEAEGYDELRDGLRSILGGPRDVREERIAVLAIGNTYDDELGRETVAHLQSPSELVRGAAAKSLAKTKPVEAFEVLKRQLAVEEDPTVRASIVASLNQIGEADPSSLTLVHGLVSGEPGAAARYEMVRYLGSNLSQFPQARATLQAISLVDSSDKVRVAAGNALLNAVP